MRHLKYTLLATIVFGLFTACSSDDSNPKPDLDKNPVEHLNKVLEMQALEGYNMALYSEGKTIQTGSNTVTAKLSKNNKEVTATDLKLSITMHMNSMGHSMSHGAPVVQFKATEYKGYYEGLLFPTMASNGENDYWVLQLTTTIDNQTVVFESKMEVKQSKDKTITSFKQEDIKYTIALINPKNPKIGLNESSALVFTTTDQETYSIANGYTIHIDPRMPSMKNHGSPNNIDFTQATPGAFYTGQLSLTMSGYWKINLMLKNAEGTIIKGNPVTEEQEASDIFFDLEF